MSILQIFSKNKKVDFLSIGDVVVDAFIKLGTAEIVPAPEGRKICLPFGEKIAFESAKEVFGVGNSANAAVSVARLGLSSAILTHTGDDQYGAKNRETLEKDAVDTSLMVNEFGKKTNYHYVLWYGDERTILINHEKYDYAISPDLLSGKTKPRYIYLSSLGENTLDFHIALGEYLAKNPEVKLVFQPGTFQIKFGTEALATLYKKTEIFFCNKEEAIHILKVSADTTIQDLLEGFKKLGVVLPVITDGPKGSYTYDESGAVIHLDIYPDIKPPLERTGAGDAFASTFAAAKASGLDTKTALMWGSINSMSVCQYVGAQEGLLKKDVLEKYLSQKPAGWEVKSL